MIKNWKILSILVLLGTLIVAAGTSENSWSVGDGAPSGNKEIIFRNGSATPPGIRFNPNNNVVELSNDGITYGEVSSSVSSPWQPLEVVALTDDAVAPGTGIAPLSWSDNDDSFTFSTGQYIISDGDGTPSVLEITNTGTATATIIDQNQTNVADSGWSIGGPNLRGGQTFTAPLSSDLQTVTFYIANNTTSAGSINVGLYAVDGSGLPTGAALASSDPIAFGSIVVGANQFTFSTPQALTQGTEYALVCDQTGLSGSATIDVQGTDVLAGGKYVEELFGTWQTSLSDAKFSIEMSGVPSMDLAAGPAIVGGEMWLVSNYLPYPEGYEGPASVITPTSGPVVKLSPLVISETKSLVGESTFTSGSCTFSRVASNVTINCGIATTSDSPGAVATSAGFVPTWARTGAATIPNNVYAFISSSSIRKISTSASGQLTWQYVNFSGAVTGFNSTATNSTLSYTVD